MRGLAAGGQVARRTSDPAGNKGSSGQGCCRALKKSANYSAAGSSGPDCGAAGRSTGDI